MEPTGSLGGSNPPRDPHLCYWRFLRVSCQRFIISPIVWLAHGGVDRPENTVALCPNCQRKMHVVNDVKDIRTLQRRAKVALRGWRDLD